MPSAEKSLRETLSPEERARPLEHTIDPGFVHRRAIEAVIGQSGMKAIDGMASRLPASLPDWERHLRTDHIYKDVLVKFCEVNGVPTLGELLAAGHGHLFCSTEHLLPCPEVLDSERVSSEIEPAGVSDYRIVLEFSTKHITSDTLRSDLSRGARLVSVIAVFNRKEGDCLFFRPLLMGWPWLRTEKPDWSAEIMWWGFDFFENFVEDFDEFSEVRYVPKPDSFEPMRNVSEESFKRCLAKILKDRTTNDWGGEQSDHYTAHLHLNGRRTTGAFLLKGPAKFTPMTLNHLGKNNDQIYRLAQEPAEVLFVQHCHDITPPVRATLRAFAVQPGRTRRYCLIDGRDSLWLLRAYDLLDEALGHA